MRVTEVSLATRPALTVIVKLVAPSGTLPELLVLAMRAWVLSTPTYMPPAGAGALNVRVAVAVEPLRIGLGETVSPVSTGAGADAFDVERAGGDLARRTAGRGPRDVRDRQAVTRVEEAGRTALRQRLPRHAGPHAMRRRIDDQVAQRPIEGEPARAHLDWLGRGLDDIEILIPEFGADRADQFLELDQFRRSLARFLAHQEDGAVGDPLELVEIGEPARAFLVVLVADRGAEDGDQHGALVVGHQVAQVTAVLVDDGDPGRAGGQRDVAAGRPSELDAIAGGVVRAGRRLGVPAPTFEELLEEAACPA